MTKAELEELVEAYREFVDEVTTGANSNSYMLKTKTVGNVHMREAAEVALGKLCRLEPYFDRREDDSDNRKADRRATERDRQVAVVVHEDVWKLADCGSEVRKGARESRLELP